MLMTPNDRSEAAHDIAFAPFNANFALQAYQPLMAGMAEFNGKACASWMEINRANM